MPKFVDLAGALGSARRYVSGGDNVLEEDVKEPRKLSETLRSLFRRVASLEAKSPPEGTEFEVDCPEYGSVTLNHNFRCPVRWRVIHWRSTSNKHQRAYCPWAERALVPTGWTNAAASQTTGVRFRMKKVTTIYGIRFFWTDNASTAYNIRVVLWNDSSGAVIAEKTVAVAESGFYDAIFDTPVTTDLTGVDITASIWENSGARTHGSNEALWHPFFPTELSEDHRMVAANLFVAGNARPTGASGATTYYYDLLLTERSVMPQLVLDTTNSTDTKLVLTSTSPGRAVILVEPSQYGLTNA